MLTEIENYRIPKLVSKEDQDKLLEKCNTKYKCLLLLMLDCGLRVSEVLLLQVKHINFYKNEVLVASLKKRKKKGKKEYRSIPMTSRLLDAFGIYFKKLKDTTPDAYVFPAGTKNSKTPHLSRIQVWRYMQKKSDKAIYPHKLRHTFATRVVNNGNSLQVAKELLGHESTQTTEIYLHVEQAQLRQAIQSIEHIPWYQRFYRKVFPKKKVFLTPVRTGMTQFHVGRKQELLTLADLRDKKVNVLLKGPQGIGKSHLLDNLTGEKILRIDEFRGKQTLGNLLIELFETDKRKIAELLFGIQLEPDAPLPDTKNLIQEALYQPRADLTKVVLKETAKRLTELAIQVTEKGEYTIIIDDVTDITKLGVRMLEKLKNHFHVIAACRELKLDKASFLTNFQIIELKPLNRVEAVELIGLASQPIRERIEDYESYKNHIWENSNGVPLFIIEMIERYGKEPNITLEITKDLRHTTALKEIDMSLFFIICISGLMVLRYVGGELGDDKGAFRLIGGVALLFALFGRPLMNMGKRKYV